MFISFYYRLRCAWENKWSFFLSFFLRSPGSQNNTRPMTIAIFLTHIISHCTVYTTFNALFISVFSQEDIWFTKVLMRNVELILICLWTSSPVPHKDIFLVVSVEDDFWNQLLSSVRTWAAMSVLTKRSLIMLKSSPDSGFLNTTSD